MIPKKSCHSVKLYYNSQEVRKCAPAPIEIKLGKINVTIQPRFGPLAFARFLPKNLEKMLDGLYSTPERIERFFGKNHLKLDGFVFR